jgi:hypothetical protein
LVTGHSSLMGTFDIESLVNLEQTYVLLPDQTPQSMRFTTSLWRRFYDTGYEEGFAHGRNHGLIEGRALGTDKGFEIWEELGYYEGFALTWQAIYAKQGRSDEYVDDKFVVLLLGFTLP